jgi:hypothetical protein
MPPPRVAWVELDANLQSGREPSGDPTAAGRKLPGVSFSRLPWRRSPWLAPAAALLVALGGCAKMDAALGKQWVDVTFTPRTTLAKMEHMRAACSHVPNVKPYPLPRQHTVLSLMAGIRFDTTNATDANVAQLQECAQKFSFVQGFAPGDSGNQGG